MREPSGDCRVYGRLFTGHPCSNPIFETNRDQPTVRGDNHRGYHYRVERDPIQLVMMAEAIMLAFSAIEEFGPAGKASKKAPSKIDGKWNPPILEDLIDRLEAANVNMNEDYNWMLRGTPRRIERILF